MAVIHDAEACATLLLRSKANPDLLDRARAANTPVHLAASYGDAIFTDMLLSKGANPMLKNAFDPSPFTLATPGLVMSLCLMMCCHEVETSAIFHRHAIILQGFGCSPRPRARQLAYVFVRAEVKSLMKPCGAF